MINQRLYVLSKDVRYRREGFGGVVYVGKTRETRFFNHAAALAIERFVTPASFDSIRNALALLVQDYEDQDRFLLSLIDAKIIVHKTDSTEVGKYYFTNITDFPNDRLYAPLGVELELTLKCMRRCLYCAYESSSRMATGGELGLTQYIDILNKLKDVGVFYTRFTGGDPLVREDCLEIAKHADDLDFGITIASDLTVLRQEHAIRLASFRNLVGIQTTLDGPMPQIADEFRGKGNFRRVVRGISLLRQHGIPVMVGTVLTKLNASRIYETAELLSQWDVAYYVSPLYAAGRGRVLAELIPDIQEMADAYDQFAAAVHDGLVRPVDLAWWATVAKMPPEARFPLWADQAWLVRSPDRLLRVDPFGRCYSSIHLKEVLNGDVYVGMLPECNLLELWHSAPLLNKVRSMSRRHPIFGDVLDIRRFNHEKCGVSS